MNVSADPFIEKYLKDDGSFRYDSWGKLDDSYEPFHNWPTFYMLGGDPRFLKLAKRQWEVITRRFAKTGVVANEFHRCDDWFHLGEGYHLFYTLCLADIQHTLPTGDRDKVDADVAELMQYWAGPEGGFVLSDYGDNEAIGVTAPGTKLHMYTRFSEASERLYGNPLPAPCTE